MEPQKASWRKLVRGSCFLLAFLQTFHVSAMQSGNSSSSQHDAASQKVMHQVQRIPLGGKLTVRMMDGTEYHGNLQATTSDDFTFDEVDMKRTLTLQYGEVAQVSKNYGGKGIGGNRVNPKRSLGVVTVIVGVIVTVLAVALSKDKS
jgi:hypothetical protein